MKNFFVKAVLICDIAICLGAQAHGTSQPVSAPVVSATVYNNSEGAYEVYSIIGGGLKSEALLKNTVGSTLSYEGNNAYQDGQLSLSVTQGSEVCVATAGVDWSNFAIIQNTTSNSSWYCSLGSNNTLVVNRRG